MTKNIMDFVKTRNLITEDAAVIVTQCVFDSINYLKKKLKEGTCIPFRPTPKVEGISTDTVCRSIS